jgi:lysophospholipase L1-like esterase
MTHKIILLGALLQVIACTGESQPVGGEREPEGKRSPHVVILGDSNSSIGGDSCDNEIGWTKWFREIVEPASCHSYARSGATWSNTTKTTHNEKEKTAQLSDDNVIYNQIWRLITAYDEERQPQPDIIIIAAGTNDAWFTKRRPHALDTVPAEVLLRGDSLTSLPPSSLLTVGEAVVANCALIKSRFPSARVILLTPLQCTATTVERIRKVGDIIESCGRLLNIAVVRQDEVSPIRREEEIERHRYTTDGTHTNAEGAEANGRILADIVTKYIGRQQQ